MPRQVFTEEERKRIRRFHQSGLPKPHSHHAVIQWFQLQTGRTISQPQVSKMLGPKWSYLDDVNKTTQVKKRRGCEWPELERVLFEWQQRMQSKGQTVTGEQLRSQAQRFWTRLPTYSSLPLPLFSTGWLDKFKARHGIRNFKRHGEAGSVDVSTMEAELVKIRAITAEYSQKDVYNMDETALYWKKTPERGLATQQMPGVKVDKCRMTIALTVNADGTDRVPLWIIGTAARPRCMKNVDLSSLRCHYRNNKKAWMNSAVMTEYLEWFDKRMSGRQVLLLMDNFSAHEAASQAMQLQNVRVHYLPPNTTSHCQPLDQGIIRTWKSYYRRNFTSWCLSEWDVDRNPMDAMTILRAIRWSVEAWELEVKQSTFHNCFRKSQVLPPVDPHLPGIHLSNMSLSEVLQSDNSLDGSNSNPIEWEDLPPSHSNSG